jgi:hypothetical protein
MTRFSSLSSSSLHLVVLVLLGLLVAVARSSLCTSFDTHMGAHFDLSDLTRSGEQPPYIVEDGDIPCTINKVEKNYTYFFNVCGQVSGYFPQKCKILDGINKAGALQVDLKDKSTDNDDW